MISTSDISMRQNEEHVIATVLYYENEKLPYRLYELKPFVSEEDLFIFFGDEKYNIKFLEAGKELEYLGASLGNFAFLRGKKTLEVFSSRNPFFISYDPENVSKRLRSCDKKEAKIVLTQARKVLKARHSPSRYALKNVFTDRFASKSVKPA